MRLLVGVVMSVGLATASCGGDGGNSFSCLSGTGTAELCIDTTTNAGGTPNCGTGMRVDACPHTGSDGGCRHAFAAGGASLAQTIWYYSGTAASTSQEMSDCVDNGGSWIQP